MTQTVSDLAAEVAGLETECPQKHMYWAMGDSQARCYGSGTGKPDELCRGTGKVPLFPWSRREQACHHIDMGISNNDPEWNYNDPDYDQGPPYDDGFSSCNCSGLGWLPLDPGDMAQRAREDKGFREWLLQYASSFNTSRGAAVWLIDLLCDDTAILGALLRMGKNA